MHRCIYLCWYANQIYCSEDYYLLKSTNLMYDFKLAMHSVFYLIATSKETPFCGCSGSNVGLSEKLSYYVTYMYFFPTKYSLSLKLNKYKKTNKMARCFWNITQSNVRITININLRHWIQSSFSTLSTRANSVWLDGGCTRKLNSRIKYCA